MTTGALEEQHIITQTGTGGWAGLGLGAEPGRGTASCPGRLFVRVCLFPGQWPAATRQLKLPGYGLLAT